ncbi:MAG TPA: Bax inhibitor-1/YccA family protein [Tepidisphaeraceae bacterium]|jgi:hypothetical protein
MSMFPQSETWSASQIESSEQTRTLLRFFNGVYAWMFVGLGVTALVGYMMSQSPAAMQLVYGSPFGYVVLGLAAFAIAQVAQTVAVNVNATLGTVLFLLYAAVMGMLLGGVFLVYPSSVLVSSFLVTAGTFASMSVVGMVLKKDLTRIGGILTMAMLGLFLASIVNVFMHSDGLSWLITYAVVVVAVGLTAYYTQMLKGWAVQYADDPTMTARMSVVGSLLLYVTFLNLFLSILRIMGSRR